MYPYQFASPLDVAIQASNGASDYGNKFGEPVICGFARSFGMNNTVNGERREWIKPIMFSGGIGCIDNEHVTKTRPQKGVHQCDFVGSIDCTFIKPLLRIHMFAGRNVLRSSNMVHVTI